MPQPILKIQIQADWNFLVFLPSTLYMMNSCVMPYIAISPYRPVGFILVMNGFMCAQLY